MKATNIVWSDGYLTSTDFEKRFKQKGCVIWFTGLSGSGKSTISERVQKELFEMGHIVYVLDGDNVRHGLNKDLGFSPDDRVENIRRIGEVAKLFRQAGIIVLTAFISPYRKDRDTVREIMDEGSFLEVYVEADIETCKKRDPKGLYEKAIAGKIPEFTGISAPYEEPLKPELTVDTNGETVEQSARHVIDLLKSRKII
ncbi:MAG: adenylyl-sulfate kinase [Ignavibacteria bacterium]|nr:adenylyl-sulfate kinase [Ignavibacteria bacterium]